MILVVPGVGEERTWVVEVEARVVGTAPRLTAEEAPARLAMEALIQVRMVCGRLGVEVVSSLLEAAQASQSRTTWVDRGPSSSNPPWRDDWAGLGPRVLGPPGRQPQVVWERTLWAVSAPRIGMITLGRTDMMPLDRLHKFISARVPHREDQKELLTYLLYRHLHQSFVVSACLRRTVRPAVEHLPWPKLPRVFPGSGCPGHYYF